MPKIHILNGEMKGHSFEFTKESVTIGRSADNDIRIKDASVSRRHGKISHIEDQFFIEDLKSQNGTWIDGMSIESGRRFKVVEGTNVAIGKVVFRIGMEDEGNDMVTKYSIDLSEMIDMNSNSILLKDRRITKKRNLQILHELSMLLMQSLDIDKILETVIESILNYLKRIDTITIILIEEDRKTFREVISRARNRIEHVSGNYSKTIVKRVIREAEAVIMSDTRCEDESNLSESIEMLRIRSIMCVPLICKSRVLGVIYAHSINVPNGFRKEDLLLFSALSNPVALAIENSRLYSECKLKEEAFRESEKKYRLLVENANDAIFIVQNGRIKFANSSAHRLKQQGVERLEGKLFEDLFHRDERMNIIRRQKDRLSGEEIPVNYYARMTGKKGEEISVQCNDVSIIWNEEPATINFLRDITRERILEEQLAEKRKMEAIRTLAGGISHDFNNLLMGIQGTTSLMMFDITAENPHFQSLKQIEDCVERGARLTDNLLGFAYHGKDFVQLKDINLIVSKSLDRVIGMENNISIRVHRKLGRDLWMAEVDQSQIEQALDNLLENAVDAMDGVGDLYVETNNIVHDEEIPSTGETVRKKYIRVSIRDTGIGMDEETRLKIFEPYFTTEKKGKKVGLGLAAVYRIIKNHDGFINVRSQKEQGTSMEIFLPAG